MAVHPKAGDEVGAGRGDGTANVWAEVGAMEAGVGAAAMVSGVDAAAAVRAGFCQRELHPQTTLIFCLPEAFPSS